MGVCQARAERLLRWASVQSYLHWRVPQNRSLKVGATLANELIRFGSAIHGNPSAVWLPLETRAFLHA